jgi:Phosphopantetheinyl transferase
LGTDFTAQRMELPRLAASVAVLDLTDTPLLSLNLPQALAGFGIPTECLEDDLSLRDAPISDSAEIRSLLARVLLRQLLSAASPTHEPQEWGFIREPGGGLHPFWPDTDNWVSLGRSPALVVAAIGPGPLGIAVVAQSDAAAAATRPPWLTKAERAWLDAVDEEGVAPALTRMGTLKNAALKAIGGGGAVGAAELDTISEPGSVLWHPEGGPDTRLHGASWPVTAGGVQHWIAVARPAGSPLVGDGTRGVSRDGRH